MPLTMTAINVFVSNRDESLGTRLAIVWVSINVIMAKMAVDVAKSKVAPLNRLPAIQNRPAINMKLIKAPAKATVGKFRQETA